MPATAGRVRMPHNNRMSTSGALKTNDLWSKTIGYDPYAAEGESEQKTAEENEAKQERSKGIMELARLSNVGNGLGDRGTDYAQQIFWGLKRKAPPKGYEVPALLNDDDDDDDSDDDREAEDDEPAVNKRPSAGEKDDEKASDDERARKERKRERKAEKKRRKEEKKEKRKKRKRLKAEAAAKHDKKKARKQKRSGSDENSDDDDD